MISLSGKQGFLCRFFKFEDEEDVKKLVEGAFPNFLGGKYWDWKYKRNPDFNPSFLIAVAEKDGKIVGCNHWIPRRFKISPSKSVTAALGADITVSPEYRKRGIGKALLLFLRSPQIIKKKGIMLSYMFADSRLGERLYKPVAGYVQVPTSTISYLKLLSWKKLRENVKVINERLKEERKLPKADLKIMFKIFGAPNLFLELGKDGVKASEKEFGKVDVTIISDLSTLSEIKEKKGRARDLLKALFTRKLKVKGGVFNIFKLYRSLWLIKEIFSGKIS